MLRALLRRAGVAVLAAASITATVSTTPAAAVDAGYYKMPHSDTVYRVVDGQALPMTHAQWVSVGSPTPAAAPTSYVKYSWAPTIYAVTRWQDAESAWQWEHVNDDLWAKAGRPAPQNTGWIDFRSSLNKWATSDELFIYERTSGTTHKLTAAEWAATGYREPNSATDAGMVKLNWAPEIHWMHQISANRGTPITPAEWTRLDHPTPRVIDRFAGDGFYKASNTSQDIVYSGPTMTRKITYTEWVAAGKPAPQPPRA